MSARRGSSRHAVDEGLAAYDVGRLLLICASWIGGRDRARLRGTCRVRWVVAGGLGAAHALAGGDWWCVGLPGGRTPCRPE